MPPGECLEGLREIDELADAFGRLVHVVTACTATGLLYLALCFSSDWVETAYSSMVVVAVLAVATQAVRWRMAHLACVEAKQKRHRAAAAQLSSPAQRTQQARPSLQSTEEETRYVTRAVQLRDKKMYTKARTLVEEGVQGHPSSKQLMVLLCELCNDEASSVRSTDPLQETALRTGYKSSLQLIESFPTACDGHKWAAVFLARLTPYKPLTEKVTDAIIVRKHARSAIEMNSSDALSNHVMGAWLYGIASLSWYQKRAAVTMCGDPLDATVDEALECLLNAHSYSEGGFMENSSLLGDCYRTKGQTEEADKWYTLALQQNKGPKDIVSQAVKIKKKMANPPPW